MMRSNLNLDSIKRSLSGLSESIKTAKTNSDQISDSVSKRMRSKENLYLCLLSYLLGEEII